MFHPFQKPSLIALLAATATLASCAPSRVPPEREVTLSLKPRFKKETYGKGRHYYTLETAKAQGDRSIYWPGSAPKPDELKRERVYTIDLIEEKLPDFGPEDTKIEGGSRNSIGCVTGRTFCTTLRFAGSTIFKWSGSW